MKGTKIAQLTEEAYKLFTKGDYQRAIEAFKKLVQLKPDNEKNRMKLAECYLKIGDKKSASQEYFEVARLYKEKGFLVQAISVAKLLSTIIPDDKRISEFIDELHKERGIPTKPKKEEPLKVEEEEIIEIEMEEEEEEEKPSIPRMSFFSSLSLEEFKEVINNLSTKSFSAGEVIVEEGSILNALYILTHGEVEIKSKGKKITTLSPGSFIGQKSFFERTPVSASAVALTDVNLLELTHQSLEEIVKKYPKVKSAVEEIYIEKVFVPILKNHPLFSAIPESDLPSVASWFNIREFVEGEIVIKEGDEGKALYIVRTGEFMVFKKLTKGKAVKLAVLGPGDIFGEISILTDGKTTASVKAIKNSTVMCLERSKFKELVMLYPVVLDGVSEIMEKRLATNKAVMEKLLQKEGIV